MGPETQKKFYSLSDPYEEKFIRASPALYTSNETRAERFR